MPAKGEAEGSYVPGEPPPAGKSMHRVQEGLWRELLNMGVFVETALRLSVSVLCEGRLDLVDEVRAEEAEIDRWEVRIETECLRLLALYGLVASDLRRVIAAFKVNRELEGLSDIAENLAKRARKLHKEPAAAPYLPQLGSLAEDAMRVVEQALNALKNVDASLARRVITADNAVDRNRAILLAQLKQAVRDEPDRVSTWLRLINSARNIERAAEHGASIAQAVIYLKEGTYPINVEPGEFGD